MEAKNNIFRERNNIFFLVLGIILILLLFSFKQAATDRAMYLIDRQFYEASVQAYSIGDYEGALGLIEKTSPVFRNESNCLYIIGLIQMQLGNYENANDLFQQVEDLSPAVLANKSFLITRGELYILTEEKTNAVDYLTHAAKKAASEEDRQYIQSLIVKAKLLP